MSKCPKCNVKLVCGCSHCQVNFPKKDGEFYLLLDFKNDLEVCENCGFKAHPDFWLDLDFKEHQKINT